MRNDYGDEKRGVERQTESDMPNVISVGPTVWFDEVWEAHGWTRKSVGDWEW
jgi:hypothetical protein